MEDEAREGDELFSRGAGGHMSGGSSGMKVRGPVHSNGMDTPTPSPMDPGEETPSFPHDAPGGFIEHEAASGGGGGEGEAFGGEPFKAHEEHHESFPGGHGPAGPAHHDTKGIPHAIPKKFDAEGGKRGFLGAVASHMRESRGKGKAY